MPIRGVAVAMFGGVIEEVTNAGRVIALIVSSDAKQLTLRHETDINFRFVLIPDLLLCDQHCFLTLWV